jgi:hypothetical protein
VRRGISQPTNGNCDSGEGIASASAAGDTQEALTPAQGPALLEDVLLGSSGRARTLRSVVRAAGKGNTKGRKAEHVRAASTALEPVDGPNQLGDLEIGSGDGRAVLRSLVKRKKGRGASPARPEEQVEPALIPRDRPPSALAGEGEEARAEDVAVAVVADSDEALPPSPPTQDSVVPSDREEPAAPRQQSPQAGMALLPHRVPTHEEVELQSSPTAPTPAAQKRRHELSDALEKIARDDLHLAAPGPRRLSDVMVSSRTLAELCESIDRPVEPSRKLPCVAEPTQRGAARAEQLSHALPAQAAAQLPAPSLAAAPASSVADPPFLRGDQPLDKYVVQSVIALQKGRVSADDLLSAWARPENSALPGDIVAQWHFLWTVCADAGAGLLPRDAALLKALPHSEAELCRILARVLSHSAALLRPAFLRRTALFIVERFCTSTHVGSVEACALRGFVWICREADNPQPVRVLCSDIVLCAKAVTPLLFSTIASIYPEAICTLPVPGIQPSFSARVIQAIAADVCGDVSGAMHGPESLVPNTLCPLALPIHVQAPQLDTVWHGTRGAPRGPWQGAR